METLIGILESTYQTASGALFAYAPRLTATFVVVVAGLLITRAAKAAAIAILEALKVEDMATKVGATDALKRADVGMSTTQIVATLVYWTFLAFTTVVALSTLGIADASTFTALGALVPNVVIAAAILVFGLNLSGFVSKLIQTAAVNAEIRQARIVRNAAHYGMGTLVLVLALRQLGVPEGLLGTGSLILFSSVCAAMALAFGLGGRDLAANISKATWKYEREQTHTLAEASNLGRQVIPTLKPTKAARVA
jgi:hypothetical protein